MIRPTGAMEELEMEKPSLNLVNRSPLDLVILQAVHAPSFDRLNDNRRMLNRCE